MTLKLYIFLAISFFVFYGIIFLYLKNRSKNQYSYNTIVYLPVYSCTVMVQHESPTILDVYEWMKNEERYELRFNVGNVFGSTQLVFIDRNIKFKVTNIKWIPEDDEE